MSPIRELEFLTREANPKSMVEMEGSIQFIFNNRREAFELVVFFSQYWHENEFPPGFSDWWIDDFSIAAAFPTPRGYCVNIASDLRAIACENYIGYPES